MENRKKFILIMTILTIILIFMIYIHGHKTATLKIGIFAGNNWDVPQGETYAIIDAVINDFEAENANVEVKYVSGIKKEDYSEWLSEQFIAGDEPDVFFILSEDFNLYVSMGALMNLKNFIKNDANFDKEVYYPAALDFGKFGEISYALPCESTLTFMFVNKTLLSKEGIAIPSNNWTWSDFLEICRKVTKDTDSDGKIDQFGYYDYSWQQAAISNGVDLFSEDGKKSYFADPRMEEAIKFIIELKKVNQGYEVSPKDFDVGKVAFRPFTFAEYRTYKPYPWRIKKYTTFEWDCIKMPAGKSGGNISILDSLLVGISARSKNKQIAWEFLKKLCYDKTTQHMILQKSQALPVRRDIIISSEAKEIFSFDSSKNNAMLPEDISDSMYESIMPYKFKNYNAAMIYADSEISKIINGAIPLNNSLNKLQKEINAFLQH